ncbi:S-4TM family putative pore-forming effector [Streptomyces sp. NPDC005141]
MTTLIGHGRTTISIVGFLWFVISAFLLKGLAADTARQGALLQEMFDIALFHMPWRATVAGDPVPEPDVRRLARKLPRGGSMDKRITNGWYDPTHGVHHPCDVLIAQEQNLAWDARLRRRYSHLIAATGMVSATVGLVAGLVIADATLGDILLSFFVPSLAAYQITYEIWSGQRKVADERDRLTKVVDAELRHGCAGLVPDEEWHRLRNVARDVQDGVLRTRLDTTRVPEWFYKRFREDDERDFGDTAEGHRVRLPRNAPPPT